MYLPDVLVPGLDLVLCGTSPGVMSAARGHYYAHPGNRFWPTLHATGLTDRLLRPAEFREVLRYGIGLTDYDNAQCGSDAEVEFTSEAAALLYEKIITYRPAVFAFNGKRGAQEFFGRKQMPYGLLPERIEDSAIFVLPSTSGLARFAWDIGVWSDLAAYVRRLRR